MAGVRFGVVVFPGSNCDRDVAWVTRGLLGCPTRLIWHRETDLSELDVVVLPGASAMGIICVVGPSLVLLR
jgi:phosphoribosylformylglycinamidine (FGAM) synthase-like amidotransferase family enzyme